MKTLNYLIPQELTQAIGYTILHSLWQGILLALALTVLFIFLPRQTAITRYRTALGTLLLQLLFSGFTFWYYYSSANTAGQIVANAHIKSSFWLQPALNQPTNYLSWANISLYLQEQLPLIVTVWLLGIGFMLLRFLGGIAYLQRLRTYKNTPLSANWHQKLQYLSTKLNLTIPVSGAESALVNTPLVIGFFKPLILLPLGTLNNLPLNQVEAILAHELAHIRRHDYLINLLQTLTEALFFYHPAIWWVSDFVRVERENCCDDQAIVICNDKLAYAQALTHLEEIKLKAPGLALAFVGKDGSLLGRIKRLFGQPTVKPTLREGVVAATVMFLCFTAISAAALANYSVKKTISPASFFAEVAAENTAQLRNNSSPVVSPSDSTTKKKEVVIIQDDKGKLLSISIDGVKVPDDQLTQYSNPSSKEVVLGGSVYGDNTRLKGIATIKTEKNTVSKATLKERELPITTSPTIEEITLDPPTLPTVTVNSTAPTAVVKGKTKASTNMTFNISTISDAPEPLYFLDGMLTDKASMNKLNPNTIQEIQVLKGVSTAKYGEAGKMAWSLLQLKPALPLLISQEEP